MQDSAADSFGSGTSCAHCGAPFTPHVVGQTLCDGCQGLAQPEPSSPLQQTEIAGYRLLRELGAGRYSHSWLAADEQGKQVVVKLLRRYAPDGEAVQRFLAEAQRVAGAAELAHPHLARPLTAGVHLASAFFLVYQHGGEHTLADELRLRGRLMPSRALEFCAQLCEGLGVAHREGLLHLDLKPANAGVVRLADGSEEAVVLDLATAHLLRTAGLREEGPLPLSSAAYLSPEEAAGRPVDRRSDLYSMGILLFQLISGRLPVTGSTADELLRAHRHGSPPRLRDLGRRVHQDLDDLIARLLSKDPARRPHGGDEASVLMRALIPFADVAPDEDGGADLAPPAPGPPRPGPQLAPPQMMPQAVDPALERAMLRELPESAVAQPALPRRAPLLPARLWPLAAGAIAVVAAVSLWSARRHLPAGEAANAPALALSSPVGAPAPAPEAPAQRTVVRAVLDEALRRDPPQDPAMLGQGGPPPPQAPAPPPRRAAPAASPYAQSFDRAQKALWTGQPAVAQSILQDVLHKALSRRDRSRASRMMGDAESKKGDRAAAARWYRKALKLSDDPDARARLSRLLSSARWR